MRHATMASRTTTVAIAGLALLAALVPGRAQAGVMGAPLKGVDVKLGKPPGGGAAARTTDDRGAFDFGVVPKGTYVLTVALHGAPGIAPPAQALQRGSAASSAAPQTCLIEIDGAVGGPMVIGWDLANARRLDTGTSAAMRGGAPGEVVVNSDGRHPLNGTVVRPKSNISNN
ncbi:MAG: carboxypeptidase regulatory-like domain-containing protein [Acidobacteria bacterium]|nr:MAG: carboxypeptidase regulatory-like domain-containing protein [Acidobacteriota bacterium]